MNDGVERRRQVVLIAGVEGGGVTLYGDRTDEGWRFCSNFVDQTPLMLCDDEDRREIRYQTRTVDSWEQALMLLDELAWLRLPPVRVHKEFRQQVWQAVLQRLGSDPAEARMLDRWRECCDCS